MAQHLEAKGATETVERRYTLADVASVSLSATGITATATVEGDEVVFDLSGGTAGTTGVIAATFTMHTGETLVDTFYVPIVAPGATGMTVRDVCEFALRKVYGKDETPEASALTDAIERLDDMLREWAVTGADVGATFPLTENTVIYCKPAYQSAIKHNLILCVAEFYDMPLTPYVVEKARRGLQLVKSDNLPDARPGAGFY